MHNAMVAIETALSIARKEHHDDALVTLIAPLEFQRLMLVKTKESVQWKKGKSIMGKNMIEPIEGLKPYRWQKTQIRVVDLTTHPSWPAVIQDAVRKWGAPGSPFTLTYEKADVLKGGGARIVIREVIGSRVITQFTPNSQGLVNEAFISLAPGDVYVDHDGHTAKEWQNRSAFHEAGNALLVDEGGEFHVSHWNADRTEQTLTCCMGGGFDVVQQDLDLLARRYA